MTKRPRRRVHPAHQSPNKQEGRCGAPFCIADRPDLGPCIAALWVDAEARGQGVAQALTDAALTRFAQLGFAQAYLAAKPHLRGFYEPRGWTLLEREVGDDRLDVFVRALP